MESTTNRSAALPDLDTMEGFAAYISNAQATGDPAVIDEVFATLARRGGKSWADIEPDAARDGSDLAHQDPAPRQEQSERGQNRTGQNRPGRKRKAIGKRANPLESAIKRMFRRTEPAPAAKTRTAEAEAAGPPAISSDIPQESAKSPENLVEAAKVPENSPTVQGNVHRDVGRDIPPRIASPAEISLFAEPRMSATLSSRRPGKAARGAKPRRRARRYVLPALAGAGVLAALLVGSPLNPLDVPVLITKQVWRAAAIRDHTARDRTTRDHMGPYAAGSEPAFTSPGETQTASPTRSAAATQPGASPTANDGIDHRNEDLAAQRKRLEAELHALAAQVAEQTARYNELRARTGEASQELAAMPEISAHIARDTSTLSALQAELDQARQRLASLKLASKQASLAAGGRKPRTATAQKSPGRTNLAQRNLATSAPPPETRFDAVQSLERQWRREGAQLIAARSALSAGDSVHAKQWIEAVQTQLVFQPVTPDNPTPGPGSNIAARLLAQAISLLNVGATSSAIAVLDRAIAYLGATPDPTSEVPAASPG